MPSSWGAHKHLPVLCTRSEVLHQFEKTKLTPLPLSQWLCDICSSGVDHTGVPTSETGHRQDVLESGA